MTDARIKPPSVIPAIRTIMMPKDTNHYGTIFGGIILSYIDQAGAIEAMRQAPNKYVTVALKEVQFKEPVLVGDVVSCFAETTYIGTSSITVKVSVQACHSDASGEKNVEVTTAEVTYVAINRNGRPTPIFAG